MATRSNIAVLNEDGTVTMVYCHWDGYPSNNGKILLENYKTYEEVYNLLSHGSMSTLKEDAETSVFYHRDRGENLDDVHPYRFPTEGSFLIDARGQAFEEWLYYFKDDKWLVKSFHDECGFQDLEHVLSQECH